MAFSGLANESARLTYTTPLCWIFQRRTRALPEGDARGSSRRIIVTGAHYSNLPRSIYLSFTSRERMWAAWRCRRLEIPRHALFTVSYWNCTRGTPLPARGNGNAFYLSPRRQPVKAAPRDRRPCFHLQIYLTFRRSLPKSLGERTNTKFDSRRIKYKSS